MGMKHRVSAAVYVAYGAITPQLASKTGFSSEDADMIKKAIQSLFEGDASSARPEGSMSVLKLVWCTHSSPCGDYSSARVHNVIKEAISMNGAINCDEVRSKLPKVNIEFLDALEGDELNALQKRL